MLHGEDLNRREIDLHAVIVALEQVRGFLKTKGLKRTITQIIIRTHSKFLLRRFASRAAYNFPVRYKKLAQEFDSLVDQIGKISKTRPVVKFWRPKGLSMAQQFAESASRVWKEAKAQADAED